MHQKPNVVIIVIDSFRKDYSYSLGKKLEKLGFINYDNVISPASWTIPSFASILTGLYPAFSNAHETKTRKDVSIKLRKPELLLSNQLLNLGYKTLLFSSNIYVSPYFGFTGFKSYFDTATPYLLTPVESKILSNTIYRLKQSKRKPINIIKKLINDKQYFLSIKAILGYGIKRLNWPKDKGIKNTIKRLREIVENSGRKNPLFIFIELMELHEPYSRGEKSAKIRNDNRKGKIPDEKIIKRWKKGYKDQVQYLETKLLELITILYKKELFDNSLIFITSDHGQLLGEHGKIGHGTYLYDELLKVPLFIKYPKDLDIELTKNTSEYISLVNLKSFILHTIEKNITDDSMLYSTTAFSESYGIPEDIKLSEKKERKDIEHLEKYRIVIYHKGIRGVFNVKDWEFEEIVSDNPSICPSTDDINQIKKEIVKFLKISSAVKIKKSFPCNDNMKKMINSSNGDDS